MLTEKILVATAPYQNPYQGKQTRLLFVCSVGMLRSPTFADVATKMGYNARSCGSSKEALIPLSVNLILWADHIIFINPENYHEAKKTFDSVDWTSNIDEKKIVMNIEDQFERNHPVLVSIAEKFINELKL